MVHAIKPAGCTQIFSVAQPNISHSNIDPSSSGHKTADDKVNISDEAKFSLQSSRLLSSIETTISIGDIEEAFTTASAYVEKRLQSLYRQFGISFDSRMEISVGRDGSILVKGQSPESDALAKAIHADDELANTIRKMSADASLLEAVKKHQEFAAAYQKDPAAAVKAYGFLLEDGHEYRVSFSMANGHIDTKVEYV